MVYLINYWDKRGKNDKRYYTWSCGDDYKEACKKYERLKKDYKHVHLKKIIRVDYYDEPDNISKEDIMIYFIEYWDKKGEDDKSHYKWSCGKDYMEACKIYERLKEDYRHVHLKKSYIDYYDEIDQTHYYDETYQSYDEPDDMSKENGMSELIFDENSMYWMEDHGCNKDFIDKTEKEINEFIESKGYIYLNQIYELLGLPWDPEKENILFKKSLEFSHKSHSSVSINFKEVKDV